MGEIGAGDGDAVDAHGAPDRRTVLGKVMIVLHAFTIDDHGVSLAELARRTDLPKASLHRIATDLVGVRLLERTPAGYRLGGQLFELGMRASVERSLVEVAIPFMEDLYERTHETVHFGIRDGMEVIYLTKIGGHRQAAAPSRVGGRMPLYCTAIGRSLLAWAEPEVVNRVLTGPLPRRTPRTVSTPGMLRQQLDRVIAEGVSFEYEESAPGIVCVGAPIFESEGRVVAGISVTGPAPGFRPQQHAASVRAAAAGIGATLARRAHLSEPSA